MDKFLENIMNFINENTTLLIIICVFLIFVLIGYLIDNSIKTRKLEKQMQMDANEDTDVPVQNEVVAEEVATTNTVEEPSIDPNTEINLDFSNQDEVKTSDVEPTEEVPVMPDLPEVPPLDDPVLPTVEEPVSVEPEVEAPVVTEIPAEPISNEVTVDPAINDLLLRDFANNGVNNVDLDNNVTDVPVVPETPVEPIVPTVEPVSVEPVVEPKKEESIYKNDKKLSDIFKKKTVEDVTPNLEKTEDYSNELDKILKKLNEATDSKDSTLEETQDFTNMF